MRVSNYLRQAKRRQNDRPTNDILPYQNDMIVGKQDLANAMDVCITSINRWIKEGMPVEQAAEKSHEWVFSLSAVKQWRAAKLDGR